MLTVSVCGVSMLAQLRYRETEQGPWRPWSFTAIASARQERGVTPAELKAYEANLQSLGAIVKRAPAVATPIGFAGELWGNLDGYTPLAGSPAGKSVPLSGSLNFAAFPLVEFMRNGRLTNEDMKGGETETLGFTVNRIDGSVFSALRPSEWSGAEAEGFLAPAESAGVAGLTRVGDVFVVKKNPKPLWIPVTLEEAWGPVVTLVTERFEHDRSVYEKQAAEFADWQTPATRAKRHAEWEATARSLPDGKAFLANMEKSDVEIEAASRARLAAGGPEEKNVKAAERAMQEVKAAVAALSPADRAGASCYVGNASTTPQKFRLVSQGVRGCQSIVKPNWAYFDAKLPRSAVQVLMLNRFDRCVDARPSSGAERRGGCVINRQLVDTMDWDAVRTMMDR